MGSLLMKLVKTLGIVISSSLMLTSAAFAAANSDKASRKGDHPPKAAPTVSRHVKPETPIVMGRSISAHHKTKLHHVQVNPAEADEAHGNGQL
jgi:hypothetical protein